MNEADILRLVEVLSSDVSGTMFRDAVKAAPQLGTLIHALGCIHAGVIAFENLKASLETEEQEAEFLRLVQLVTERAKTKVQIHHLNDNLAKAGVEVGHG